MSSPHGKNSSNPDSGYAPYNPVPPTGPPPYSGYPNLDPPPQEYPQPGYPQPGYPQPGYPQHGYPQPAPPVQGQGTTVFQASFGTSVIPGTVIVQQVIGPEPTRATCRSCNESMVTRVERNASMRTHLMAVLLCVLGCWPCVCIPYCMDSCLNTDHYCSKCGAFVGTYLR